MFNEVVSDIVKLIVSWFIVTVTFIGLAYLGYGAGKVVAFAAGGVLGEASADIPTIFAWSFIAVGIVVGLVIMAAAMFSIIVEDRGD